MAYRLRPRAERDLVEIGEFIAVRNPGAATAFVRRIAARLELLGDYLDLGRQRDDVAPGMRHLPVGEYLVLYRKASFGADVVRIVHGARRLKRLV